MTFPTFTYMQIEWSLKSVNFFNKKAKLNYRFTIKYRHNIHFLATRRI